MHTAMLLATVLLALLALGIHGRPQFAARHESRFCSRWTTGSAAVALRSMDDRSACAGETEIERRGFQVRACCAARAVARSDSDFPTTCGKQQYQPVMKRIVGGSIAKEHSWPWQVELEANGNICGGSLIDTTHVLTAAHCINSPNEPEKFKVNVGRHIITQQTEEENSIVAAKIFMHEEYNPQTMYNDIAIIRLSRAVQISDKVNTICLPGPEADNGDQTVWVVGWGTTTSGGQISEVLKQAGLHPMPEVCQQIYANYNNEMQMCAGVHGGGHDSCQGDSGGPLMFESEGTWYLNGVVSYGAGCAFAGKPGVYTRVKYYLPWIRNIIG